MNKPNEEIYRGRSGGLCLSFPGKESKKEKREDIQICIQPTIFADYLMAEHDFTEEAAAKVAEDFFALKLLIRNNGSRTRVQLNGDKIFNILRVPSTEPLLTTV